MSSTTEVTVYMMIALVVFILLVYVQKRDNGLLKEGEIVLLFILGLAWPVTFVCYLLRSEEHTSELQSQP